MIVYLDSNIVIYDVEGDPFWAPKVDHRLKGILAAGDTVAASDAVRMECLVGPFRTGNTRVLADYQKFFSTSGIQMLPVTPAVWERAVQIRAAFISQALDSIHLAAAIKHGGGLFLTNDAQFAGCTTIRVEVLP